MGPAHFEREKDEIVKKCSVRHWAGMTVTDLLGAHSQSDVAGEAQQVLCILTGLPVAGREDSPDGSGLMLIHMTSLFMCHWGAERHSRPPHRECKRSTVAGGRVWLRAPSVYQTDTIWLGRFNSTAAKYQDSRLKLVFLLCKSNDLSIFPGICSPVYGTSCYFIPIWAALGLVFPAQPPFPVDGNSVTSAPSLLGMIAGSGSRESIWQRMTDRAC